MSLIDRRSIWLLLILKGLRAIFFILISALFLYVIKSPPPDGLSIAGWNAIAVFSVCLVFWVSNVIPLAITSILAIVLVSFLGVLPKREVYALFGNEAVFFILGAFILAGAVMHSGLSNRVALAIMKRFGSTPKNLLLSVYLICAGLSFFMSEHAVAAMMFPIVFEIAKALDLKPGASGYGKLLFLSLAWGCIIGGVATFLGGARVPLAAGILKESTGITMGFLSYTLSALPVVAIMLAVGFFILTRAFKIDIDNVDNAVSLLSRRVQAIGKIGYVESAVGVILILTVVGWIIWGTKGGLATIALASVVALFALRLVRWKDIEEYVNWGIILMYGGAIVLGAALERSGAAIWLAEKTIGTWATTPLAAIALFSLFAILLTEAMSNAAVIAVLLPVGIGLSGRFNMDPSIVTYAIAIPAGLAFSLPMSTPANAIAVSSNYIKVRDMAKVGVIMVVLSWVVFNAVARIYWPLIGLTGLYR